MMAASSIRPHSLRHTSGPDEHGKESANETIRVFLASPGDQAVERRAFKAEAWMTCSATLRRWYCSSRPIENNERSMDDMLGNIAKGGMLATRRHSMTEEMPPANSKQHGV